MASAAIWYWVDLSGLDQAEFERVYSLLEKCAFTGLKEEEGYRQYTFVWNEQASVEEITGLPSSVLHRLSGR